MKIWSSSRDVRPFVVCCCLLRVVPFPCDSPRGAKEVPGEQSCLPPWHQYPEKMYIKKCPSLQLAISGKITFLGLWYLVRWDRWDARRPMFPTIPPFPPHPTSMGQFKIEKKLYMLKCVLLSSIKK